MTSARIIAVSLAERDFFFQAAIIVKKLNIVHLDQDNWALFAYTYMYELSTWPVFSFMHIWLWYPTVVLVGN